MGSVVGGFLRILSMFGGFCVFLLVVIVLSSNSDGVQTRHSSPPTTRSSSSSRFNKASLEVVIRGRGVEKERDASLEVVIRGRGVEKERDASIHHHHPPAAAAGGLDPNYYMSKRKVPNGPDPIHNRRTGNSGRPPGRA